MQGDITTLDVDAIVNAANKHLRGGGGVDGAIHRAAGEADLHAACRALGRCATGDAKITPGFALAARYIIHAVGPDCRDRLGDEPEKLTSAYLRSLQIARVNGCRTVAFPAISTGVFGFPFEDAARIALRVTVEFLASSPLPETVFMVYFSASDLERAQRALAELSASS